jgi:hypothetical protein
MQAKIKFPQQSTSLYQFRRWNMRTYLTCMSSLCASDNKQLPLRAIRSYRTRLYQAQNNTFSEDFLSSWLLCMRKYSYVQLSHEWSEVILEIWTDTSAMDTQSPGTTSHYRNCQRAVRYIPILSSFFLSAFSAYPPSFRKEVRLCDHHAVCLCVCPLIWTF